MFNTNNQPVVQNHSSDSETEADKAQNYQMMEDDFDKDELFTYMEDSFLQENYLFLFDEKLKFSQRRDFNILSDLEYSDIMQMNEINRTKLYNFLSDLKNLDIHPDVARISAEFTAQSLLDANGQIDEEKIYDAFMSLLTIKEFGFNLKLVVAHFEYFVNTVNRELQSKITNPF